MAHALALLGADSPGFRGHLCIRTAFQQLALTVFPADLSLFQLFSVPLFLTVHISTHEHDLSSWDHSGW